MIEIKSTGGDSPSQLKMSGLASEVVKEALSIGLEMGNVYTRYTKSGFGEYIQMLMKYHKIYSDINEKNHADFDNKVAHKENNLNEALMRILNLKLANELEKENEDDNPFTKSFRKMCAAALREDKAETETAVDACTKEVLKRFEEDMLESFGSEEEDES